MASEHFMLTLTAIMVKSPNLMFELNTYVLIINELTLPQTLAGSLAVLRTNVENLMGPD